MGFHDGIGFFSDEDVGNRTCGGGIPPEIDTKQYAYLRFFEVRLAFNVFTFLRKGFQSSRIRMDEHFRTTGSLVVWWY